MLMLFVFQTYIIRQKYYRCIYEVDAVFLYTCIGVLC